MLIYTTSAKICLGNNGNNVMVWSDGSAEESCSCRRPEPVVSTPAIIYPHPGDLTQSTNLEGQTLLCYTCMHSDKALMRAKFSKRKKKL